MPSVLLVSPYLPPHIGGVERYVETIAQELAASDWRVVIASPARHGMRTPPVSEGSISVRYLNAFGRLSNTPVGFRWGHDLRRIIEEEAIDVVNAHTPVPGLADAAQRAAGAKPFVLTYHAGPMRKNVAAVNIGLRAYERFVVPYTVRRSSFLICSSAYVREFLETFPHDTPTAVIPPGVNVRHYGYAPYTDRKGLLFVAALERATNYKALDSLIEAVASLATQGETIGLDVLGDGDARPEYEAQCRGLGVSDLVTFHGAADPRKLAHFYQRAAALVLPSRHDSFPTVILEAMACGTPVIASRVGGIPTFVHDDRNGLLIEPGSSTDIVSAVKRLLADRELGVSLGAAGRQTVEESWTSEMQGKRTSDVLKQAISTKAGRRRPQAAKPELAPQAVRRNLLIIAPYFPPYIGGVEQYTWNLANALIATKRWNVTILTTKAQGFRSEVSYEDGLRVIRLASWFRFSNTPLSPLWPWQMRRYIKRLNPEVVNAHTPVPIFADMAAWASGSRPFLLTYHAATLKKGDGRLFNIAEQVYGLLERYLLRRSDAVLAVSDYVRDTLRDRVHGSLVSFSNAVPAASLSTEPARPIPGQFVFIARLAKKHRWKGLESILEALVLCPSARLKVAGDGDLRSLYERRAHELGISDRVDFLGTVSGKEKDELIGNSTALIAYPTTCNDAFPTVLLEAWAARVPVIVADIGALTSLVNHGIDGLIVPPSQPQSLAHALAYLIEDPAAALRYGEKGRERMKDLTWESQALRFEELVGSVHADRIGAKSRV
jgi:glycosyltransferase involved in cell wall biosynthesis